MTADVVVSAFAATVTSGSNYPNGIWKSIPLTGGNGTGMLVNLNVQNGGVQPFGGVSSSEFVSVTSNYTVGDVLTGGIPQVGTCLLYTSPSPRDATLSRMPSSA